ncbi:integrase core domain protein [Ancylostoma ceylanicum]|uniref:Integrase core domain protein n=1 Tax=Ancylostoma ceylanicum TaxID=53326 RepID=A0A0D6MC12_9BILA|nr:integrase core domain protein [Ancylostoma ceylanicum]
MANAQMSSSMEGDVNDVVNITDEMDNELQANVVPDHLIPYGISTSFQEIIAVAPAARGNAAVVLKTVSKVIQALFIFYVYIIFRDSVQMIENYKTDVDFNNCFITSEFWQIDHHRELLGQQAIRYISSSEMRNWKLMNVFSAPTRAELDRAKGALMSWFVTTFVAALLVFMDYYLYAFLNAVVSASHTKIEQLGSSSAAIEVEGDGVVAQFVRAMIADNRTVEVDSSMTNAHCLMPPQRPNFQHIFTWIALPLIISLLLQVIFSFVVKRVIINHFMAFMFPLRDRIRIIYLYNKVLFMRLKHRQESRARIRFIVDRWKINEEYDEGGWLSYRSWFKLNVLDRLFKTGQCLMCQVEEGLVNTERSLVTYAHWDSPSLALGQSYSVPMDFFLDNYPYEWYPSVSTNDARSSRFRGTHVKFYYVQSDQNPADCASRGLPTRSAQNHIWWCGPSFLVLPSSQWPKANCEFNLPPDVSPEVENEFQTLTAILVYSYQSPLRFQATNSYLKLVRSTAYVLKFVSALFRKIRHRPSSLNLSHSTPTKLIDAVEFTNAETLLITEQYRESVQQLQKLPLHRFNAHRSADGLLRCPNRLEHDETSTISAAPILLVPAHPLTNIVVMHHHLENLHSGAHATIASLRRRFFIPSIRSTVVKILRDCLVCKKANCLPYRYPDMPSLPPERVNRFRPFQKVGLDYLGPVYYRDSFHTKAKVWVCLFTCMATRAVHLEVVIDNTVQEFLLAFRRFVARRGTPDYVLSDNATTFHSASDTLHVIYTRAAVEKLTNEFTKRRITWKFITPLSPWKGGFYERLVGLFKSAFRKAVHRILLPLQQLQTLVCEIEAVLNSRPLLSIRDTCTAPHVLKPIDFISPEVDLQIPPERSLASFPSHRLADWYRGTVSVLDQFWNIWYKDYLSVIADRHQKRIRQGRSTSVIPQVSDVVLIAEENVPRGQWPLGVITALGNVNDDGPGSATVRMPNGRLVQRSLNHLYPLEIAAFEDQEEPKETEKRIPTRIQPPRAVKRVRFYSR